MIGPVTPDSKKKYPYIKIKKILFYYYFMIGPVTPYSHGKRGRFTWQKRPIHMAKEADSHGKRGLFTWQKRPIHMAKEAYAYGKRSLLLSTLPHTLISKGLGQETPQNRPSYHPDAIGETEAAERRGSTMVRGHVGDKGLGAMH